MFDPVQVVQYAVGSMPAGAAPYRERKKE